MTGQTPNIEQLVQEHKAARLRSIAMTYRMLGGFSAFMNERIETLGIENALDFSDKEVRDAAIEVETRSYKQWLVDAGYTNGNSIDELDTAVSAQLIADLALVHIGGTPEKRINDMVGDNGMISFEDYAQPTLQAIQRHTMMAQSQMEDRLKSDGFEIDALRTALESYANAHNMTYDANRVKEFSDVTGQIARFSQALMDKGYGRN